MLKEKDRWCRPIDGRVLAAGPTDGQTEGLADGLGLRVGAIFGDVTVVFGFGELEALSSNGFDFVEAALQVVEDPVPCCPSSCIRVCSSSPTQISKPLSSET